MGAIKNHPNVLLFLAAFSPSQDILMEGKAAVVSNFGPLFAESDFFRFDNYTDYYAGEMGEALYKQLWCFQTPIRPETLSSIKVKTNNLENEIATRWRGANDSFRPINLDPGYIDLGKLILASTKDHAHRIYLDHGIFAETTLMYTQKQWKSLPWTYPDYQSNEYHTFLDRCREYLLQLRRESR